MTAVATTPGIRIEEVRVGERARKDYGDLTSLKDSIAEHGLIQPIVLLPDDYLLCGGRRLEACHQLGWEAIPFVRVADQGDAISRLKAERDENTCRKDMTPSELVAIGLKIEELKRPEAEAREYAGLRRGSEPGVPLMPQGKSGRQEVAEAVGMSQRTYARARRVVETADDPYATDTVRATAVEARAAMDAGTISIKRADETVAEAIKRETSAKAPAVPVPSGRAWKPVTERIAEIRDLAATGMTSAQIGKRLGVGEQHVRNLARDNGVEIVADKTVGSRRRLDGNRVIGACVLDASTLISPSLIEQVNFADLDRDHLEEWVSSLSESIRALQALKRSLEKELNRG